jgi:RNA polymerase sigma-70 factor (ECF subfamily)
MSASQHRADTRKTIDLLIDYQGGDVHAFDHLYRRLLRRLLPWAHHLASRYPRGMVDAQDLLQEALVRALPRLPSFRPDREGALQAFLRQTMENLAIDEWRRFKRRGLVGEVSEDYSSGAPSALDLVIRAQVLRRYRAAMRRLPTADQMLLEERLGRRKSFAQIAHVTGRPSANAARVAVTRAVAKLVKAVDVGGRRPGATIPPEADSRRSSA